MLKGPISERKSSEAQTSGPVPSGGLPPDNEVPGKEPDSQQQDRRSSHGKVTGAMATTLAFLPYQSAPFMVAYGFRQFSMQQLVLTQGLISMASLVLICPLNLLYWRWLGLI